MSRTRRKWMRPHEVPALGGAGAAVVDYIGSSRSAIHRDRKPWWNPVGVWKRMRRQIRRARFNQALRVGKEIEVEKHDDKYDWN